MIEAWPFKVLYVEVYLESESGIEPVAMVVSELDVQTELSRAL